MSLSPLSFHRLKAFSAILSPLEFYFFCIKFIKLCPFYYSLDSFFSQKVPFFIAFSLFLIIARPRPFFGLLADRVRGGIAPKFQHFSTPKNRRLHASDPVFSRMKRDFPPLQQFQQPYIHNIYTIYNTRNKTIIIYNNKTPPIYTLKCWIVI